jgi:dynein heavy chain 1, cytosolic
MLGQEDLEFGRIVEVESEAKSPLLLISAAGYDASFKVDEISKKQSKKLFSVAIGSAEGFEQAEQAIMSASKIGSWVLLKNVHLAPTWLYEIEKKIHQLTPHKNFRIFMTMEFNPKVPSSLIRISRTFVFEPPSGIKASLQRTF